MGTLPFTIKNNMVASSFNYLFNPCNEWLKNESQISRAMSKAAVNITEQLAQYQISLAVPRLKKENFKIGVTGNILTVSDNRKELIEEKEKKFTQREYSYASFSRSFTILNEINSDKTEASYEDGILTLSLPRKEFRNVSAKQIAVG